MVRSVPQRWRNNCSKASICSWFCRVEEINNALPRRAIEPGPPTSSQLAGEMVEVMA